MKFDWIDDEPARCAKRANMARALMWPLIGGAVRWR